DHHVGRAYLASGTARNVSRDRRGENAVWNGAREIHTRWKLRARIRRLPETRPRSRRSSAHRDSGSKRGVPKRAQFLRQIMSKGKYYFTTPIYYVNAAPHIGTAYCTFTADLIKRFKRQQGYEPVVLTTGSDEHGQNVERAAKAIGKSPEEYATAIANEFVNQWQRLGISYDNFIRTSDPKHFAVVHDLFERCERNGYIYKGSYTGQYCFHDELYVVDAKPGDPCPDCGRITETVTEENYFFKLSAFQDKLLELYEQNRIVSRSATRKNELVAFVKQGLHDLSITRTTLNWGIPVP